MKSQGRSRESKNERKRNNEFGKGKFRKSNEIKKMVKKNGVKRSIDERNRMQRMKIKTDRKKDNENKATKHWG